MAWTPPPRPGWVERLIAHGDAVGGPEHVVALDPDVMIDEARRSTGLSDFGGEGWRAHYEVLVASLERESHLHLVGRLLVRTEIVQALRNRLRLADLWRRRPGILETPVDEPVFIVGSPRSGTSILHELMASDPATRAPAMWEMQHPVDAVEGRDRSAVADLVTRFWSDVQPEYETMHANSGHLPNECIFITLHEFLSDHWSGCHVVPAYEAHLHTSDQATAYAYHRRFLQTLQLRGEGRRWLLKAPSHLSQLRTLFAVYPDARIIRTHRDPLDTLPSAVSLMGTLKWIRCHSVDMSRVPAQLASGYAWLYQREIEQRDSGELPDDRFVDVQFDALVRDPVGMVEEVYERLDWELTDVARSAVSAYAAATPKDARGVHRYSLEEMDLGRDEERERFRFYTEHYGVSAGVP